VIPQTVIEPPEAIEAETPVVRANSAEFAALTSRARPR
jgi:hypothetical protein